MTASRRLSPTPPDARTLPGYYNDLDAALTHAWAMMERGAADRRSAFRTPVVATVDSDGAPAQRIMVLRGVETAERTLRLHTDVRSAKLRHLAAEPRVGALFYDATAKLQVRLAGTATVHIGDDVAAAAWSASLPQSRLCYEQIAAPGTALALPLPELPVDARAGTGDDGAVHFAVLRVIVDLVDWLYLAIEGHRRARWHWDGRRWAGTWLVP